MSEGKELNKEEYLLDRLTHWYMRCNSEKIIKNLIYDVLKEKQAYEQIRHLIQNPKPKVDMKLVEKYWERFCVARYEGFEDNCSIEEFCQMFKKLGMEIEQK